MKSPDGFRAERGAQNQQPSLILKIATAIICRCNQRVKQFLLKDQMHALQWQNGFQAQGTE
jgi:hypothetical protein